MDSIYNNVWRSSKTPGGLSGPTPPWTRSPDTTLLSTDPEFSLDDHVANKPEPKSKYQLDLESAITDDGILGSLDKAQRFSKGLGIAESGLSLLSAAQSVFAKPTTVTPPTSVAFQRPQVKSEVESSRAMIKENMGTGINSWLQSSREMGFNPTRAGAGIFGHANRVMRESSVDLSMRNQDLVNQASIIDADIAGKESMVNAELINRFHERRDSVMAADSHARGVQFSQAISNIGAIASRSMNDQILIQKLRSFRKDDIRQGVNDRYNIDNINTG